MRLSTLRTSMKSLGQWAVATYVVVSGLLFILMSDRAEVERSVPADPQSVHMCGEAFQDLGLHVPHRFDDSLFCCLQLLLNVLFVRVVQRFPPGITSPISRQRCR